MRVRRLCVHDVIFLNFLKAGDVKMRIVGNAVPDDVELVRAGHDEGGRLWLILQSAEWEEVPNGAIIPEHPAPIVEDIR